MIKYFEEDENRIPVYSQILIDEFQDFNQLESRLLSFLSTKSPILIVGDDDQSLYDFKYANPSEIRSKYNSEEYTSFELPFCSRCTEAVINAYNHLIIRAKSEGFLTERSPKTFSYFPSEEKDAISNRYSKII